MSDVETFFLATIITASLSAIGILLIRSQRAADAAAMTFYLFTVAVSLLGFLYTALTLRSPEYFSVALHRLLFYRFWIVIGVAVQVTRLTTNGVATRRRRR